MKFLEIFLMQAQSIKQSILNTVQSGTKWHIYTLKLSTENCGQTAADGDMVTIDSL